MTFDTIFAFEQDFAGELRCIPMAVRYKLDLCGIKLSLRQWSRFTPAERHALVLQACEAPAEIAQYHDKLTTLITTRAEGGVKILPIEATPAWADEKTVPDQITAYAKSLNIEPPSLQQWRALTILQRFTLWKLSYDNHDNVNFIPALREFALLPAQGLAPQGLHVA